MKCSLGISNFIEEISSLSYSIVVLCFFALVTEEVFLISPCYSLGLCIQCEYLSFSPLPFTSLLFTAICKAPSDNHFVFLHFLFLVMVLIPASVQCHEPPSIVLQGLCLSDLIPWMYFSLPLYNHKGFDLGHTWLIWFSLVVSLVVFPTFFNLSQNLAIRGSWSQYWSLTNWKLE